MMSSTNLLCLLLCCWYADETVGTTNPGLKIRLSQPGLNYASRVAVQRLAAKVRGTSLPDHSGQSHTSVGKVDYEVQNIKVTSFQQPSTSVTTNPGSGLTWSLSGAGVSLHGDWHVKYKLHFVHIQDHGSFDTSASGASISVSVTLGATAAGQPTVRSTDCNCHVDSLRIRIHGGASWLYNLFMRSVERNMRNNLQRKICNAAQNAVNTDVVRELATLPVKVPLGQDKQWLLDYRLVSPPAFAYGYFESFHKGEFFHVEDTTEAPFQPSPLPSPPIADHMATFWASSYILNTAGYVLQKRGVLRYNLTKKDLRPKSRDILNTSCSFLTGCIGALVPPVGKMFPNASVEVEMFSTAAPLAGIDPHNLTGSFAGVTVLHARVLNGSLAHLFSMNVTAKMTAIPRLDGTVLKAEVMSMEETLAVINSSVGPISTTLLGLVFKVAKTLFVIPKLNEAFEMGIPLPTVKDAYFTNTNLQLEHDCVRVSTDFTHSSSVLYYQP